MSNGGAVTLRLVAVLTECKSAVRRAFDHKNVLALAGVDLKGSWKCFFRIRLGGELGITGPLGASIPKLNTKYGVEQNIDCEMIS